MIDNEKVNELFKEYRQTGDIKIRNKLVENYIYLAEILAKKFSGRGVEYDDLYQVASEALISGVEKFDPDLGYKFTTYITPTITGMIKNYFRDYSRSVRLPRRIYAVYAKLKEAKSKFFIENGVVPTVKQLAEILQVSEEDVIEALEYRAPLSLDAKTDDGENESTLMDVIPDSNNSFEKFEMNESLKAEIEKLQSIEKDIVNLRFVQNKSQAETGKILGVNQMFVSRTERKILNKLKESLL